MTKRLLPYTFVLTLLCVTFVHSHALAQEQPVSEGALCQTAVSVWNRSVPERNSNPELLIPVGWQWRARQTGDLNNDSLSDMAGVIHTDQPSFAECDQLLVVLFREQNTQWRRVVLALVFQSTVDAGASGNQGAVVEISRGVLITSESLGSPAQHQNDTQRYRWMASENRFVLIGEDSRLVDGGTATVTSFNRLTGRQIIETQHYRERDGRWITTRSQRNVLPLPTVVWL